MTPRLIVLAFILTGCTSSPRYSDVWVHDTFDSEEQLLAKDRCSLEAGNAKTNFLKATPVMNGSSNEGAINNFTRKLDSSTAYVRAHRVCMRTVGFRKEQRCVSNCEQI